MNVKNKGRFGDTETRKVGGLLSHVTKEEADIIDKYGREGEALVQQFGSGTINPNTGLPEYWGWNIKSVLSKGMNSLMKGVTDAGNKIAKGSAGKFWDTHIGRKGIFGEGLEYLGLGDSGTTTDRKNRAKNRIQEMADESTDLFNRSISSIDGQTQSNIYGQNSLTQKRINKVPQSNLATNNSRGNFVDNIIAGNIRDQNKVISDGMSKKISAEQSYNLEQAKYDAEKKAV